MEKPERIVLKIGSSSLSEPLGGLSYERLGAFVDGFASLPADRYEIVVVSSGAVAAGFRGLGLPGVPRAVVERQAAAALGQSRVMQAYTNALAAHDRKAAQLLLTRGDFSNERAFQNAYAVINELLHRRVVPIINENDSVAVEELNFGDNDMLAALVGALVHADMVFWLTDTDGFYSADPRRDPTAERYREIQEVTDELVSLAGDSGSAVGTGGMRTKLVAARLATSLGVRGYIGRGHTAHELRAALSGEGAGTYFAAGENRSVGRKKQWIAFHSHAKGVLVVDDGAREALCTRGKSLLAVGVREILGEFQANDVVEIRDGAKNLLGRGVSNFAAGSLRAVQGRTSSEIETALGTRRTEVVHRDKWFPLEFLGRKYGADNDGGQTES